MEKVRGREGQDGYLTAYINQVYTSFWNGVKMFVVHVIIQREKKVALDCMTWR